MYFSKIRLNQTQQARRVLLDTVEGGAYGSHQLLWRLFNADKRQFLYRQELGDGDQADKGEPVFYALSAVPPEDTDGLFEIQSKAFSPRLNPGDRLAFKLRVNPTVCREGKRHDVLMDAQMGWLRKQLEQLGQDSTGKKSVLKARLLDFASDAELAYWRELISQGCHKETLAEPIGRGNALELALKSNAERALEDWWQRRVPGLGIEDFPGSVASATGYQRQAIPKKHREAAFSSVDLAGEIQISDPDTFIANLHKGIGRAKSFGCGLMMIRRV